MKEYIQYCRSANTRNEPPRKAGGGKSTRLVPHTGEGSLLQVFVHEEHLLRVFAKTIFQVFAKNIFQVFAIYKV